MRTLLLACSICASIATPAVADLAHFEFAFTEVCFKPLPDLSGAAEKFPATEWDAAPGADDGEWEFYSGSTAVFLRAVAVEDGPGCTVMDTQVPKLAAEWILELALEKYFNGAWQKAVGYNDQPVWRLRHDKLTTEFYINDGLDGGAAIALGIRTMP